MPNLQAAQARRKTKTLSRQASATTAPENAPGAGRKYRAAKQRSKR